MTEEDELRELLAEEKRRVDAYEDMIGVAVADAEAYRSAFKKLLELLPGDSPLRVTGSVPLRPRRVH